MPDNDQLLDHEPLQGELLSFCEPLSENNDEKSKLDSKGNHRVSKRNELIDGYYKLSTTAHNIMALILSRVNPLRKDSAVTCYKFTAKELAEALGCSTQYIYKQIDKVTDELQQKVIRIRTDPKDDKSFLKINIFHSSRYNNKTGEAEFQFHEELQSQIVSLSKGNYSSYLLKYFLSLESAYSKRLYELCRKSHSLKKRPHEVSFWQVDVIELQKLFGIRNFAGDIEKDAKSYEKYGNFKRRVLSIALNEVNAKTDLLIEFEPSKKKGNSIVQLRFRIKTNVGNTVQIGSKLDLDNATHKELFDFGVKPELIADIVEFYGESLLTKSLLFTRGQMAFDEINNPVGFLSSVVAKQFEKLTTAKEKIAKKKAMSKKIADISNLDW